MNKVKSHLKHKKQTKIVYEIEVIFHKALNLSSKDENKQVYVVWRRGNGHYGQTSKAKQVETTADWLAEDSNATNATDKTEEARGSRERKDSLKTSQVLSNSIRFRCSLYRNNDGAFDPKILEIKLKQEKEKRPDSTKSSPSRSVGEITLNLADFAEKIGDETTKSIPVSQALIKKQKTKDPKVTACKLQFTVRMHSNGIVIRNPSQKEKSRSLEGLKPSRTSPIDDSAVDISSQYSRHSNHSLSSSPETVRTTSTKSSTTLNSSSKYNGSGSQKGSNLDQEGGSFGRSSQYSSYSSDEDDALSDEDRERFSNPSLSTSKSNTDSTSSTNSPRRWLIKQESASSFMRNSSDEDSVKKTPVTNHSHVFGANPLKSSPQQRVQLENFKKGHRRARSDASAFSFTQTSQSSAPSIPTYHQRMAESHERLPSRPLKNSAPSVQREQKKVMISSLDNDEIKEMLAKQESELEYLKQQLAEKQQLEDENYIIEKYVLLMEPEFTRSGMPTTAYLIFRCILHWRSFDKQNSRFLDRIVESFDKLLQKHLYNSSILLYWLATACVLLHQIRRELQVIAADSNGTSPVKLFEKRLQMLIGSYYATLLKSLYEKLDPLIIPAILEQPTLGSVVSGGNTPLDVTAVISLFNEYLHLFKQSFIFPDVQEQFFRQVLYHSNERIFNTLLQRKELCRCGNGVMIKMGVSQLEEWALAHQKILKNVADQLAPLRNAADLLVMNKAVLAEEQNRREACPSLNDKQILHILRSYTPDEFDSEPVHPGVLSELASKERDSDQLLFDSTFAFPLITSFDHRLTIDVQAFPIPTDLSDRPGFVFLRDEM
eukprot:TRINITY_DN3019_c0_g1_i1.p1 TRINITY_DN3019_c0_g1~~TRINITY_DN3019_c0_g1_i1.p1  ORF type:complete len:829 (+),score=208.39 TRINITY_DN3019_c0_g1_i1:148-2634(+)